MSEHQTNLPEDLPGVEPEAGAAAPVDPKSTARGATPDLELGELVGDWSSWAQVAEALRVPVSRVRQMVRDRQLAEAVPAAGAGQRIPTLLVAGHEVVKGVPGLITVLTDNGFDDREIIRWMFTEDESLPGRPIDALRENRGREAKRRAQVMMKF